MDGSIIGLVHCAQCNTVDEAIFQTSAVYGGDHAHVGDELLGCNEYVLRPGASDDDNTFLESYACAGCGVSWVLVTMAGGRLAALEGVTIEDGLARADFAGWSVFEAFKDATQIRDGEPAGWAATLAIRAVMRGPLQVWPWRLKPIASHPRKTMVAAGQLAESVTDGPGRTIGIIPDVLELPSGTRCAPAERASEVSPLLADYATAQDDDTWVVGRNADDLWQFVPGAHLRAWIRQACIARGIAPPPPYSDDYPCGLTVAGGAWTIVCLLAGAPERGVYLAMAADGNYGLATLTSPQRDSLATVEARLARRDDPRLTPLVAIGPVEGASDELVAIVEPLPDGHPLSTWWIPFHGDDACDLASALLRYLATHPTPVGGLRPETIFVTRGSAQPWPTIITGLAPRGEAFMAGQAPRSVGSVTPYRYLYDAPEVLRGGPPTLASDVFAATAVIAHMATGAHPFEGESAFMQLSAIVGGQRRAYHGPPVLEALIARGLAADPGQRPSAAELAAAFAAAVPLPPG
ncbi:MAG: hypothetical protein IPH44_28525 [Myxococcales bacterium]|nr:hypothetical protein [Myxococcales bacterium]MBK7191448.1 hypothetical protein [Myxococcales bacterium]